MFRGEQARNPALSRASPGLSRCSLVFVDKAAEDWPMLGPLAGEVGQRMAGPWREGASYAISLRLSRAGPGSMALR